MKNITYICDGCHKEMPLLENHEITVFDMVTLNLCTNCHMAVLDAIKIELENIRKEQKL